MSERSFFRSFSRSIGTTPARFVEEARVNRAKSLLEESGDLLDEVAYNAGFGSVDALLRSFQKIVGITPTAYRERFRISPSVADWCPLREAGDAAELAPSGSPNEGDPVGP